MRVTSSRDVPRVDLTVLRRLVPALWAEWASLEFASDGWLLDPDTRQPLRLLRLAEGRHRAPGAHYTLVHGTQHYDFVLASDERRNLRGTLSGPFWSADVELGDRLGGAGRLDVAGLLRANQVPGILASLIGTREATGDVRLDPSALDRRGDLLTGNGRAQRAAGDVLAQVKTSHGAWHGHVVVHVSGRGLLGRLALLGFRSKVRSAVKEGVDEMLSDTATEAEKLRAELPEIERQISDAGGADAFVHTYVWQALRELAAPAEPVRDNTASPTAATAAPAEPRTRLRGGPLGVRRLERAAEFRFPASAAQYLVSHGSVFKTGELIVRPGRDSVQVHRPSQGRYDNPPVLHGRVDREPDALTIRGPIRETRSARTWALGWGFVTGLMTLTAIFGIVLAAKGQSGALAPLLIGAIAAPIFALFWHGARRDRRPDFERQADELEDSVRRWFTSGDGRRGYVR